MQTQESPVENQPVATRSARFDVLKTIIEVWDAEEIQYAFARGMPRAGVEPDVEVVIETRHFDRGLRLALLTLKKVNWSAWAHHYWRSSSLFAFAGHGGELQGIRLTLVGRLQWGSLAISA